MKKAKEARPRYEMPRVVTILCDGGCGAHLSITREKGVEHHEAEYALIMDARRQGWVAFKNSYLKKEAIGCGETTAYCPGCRAGHENENGFVPFEKEENVKVGKLVAPTAEELEAVTLPKSCVLCDHDDCPGDEMDGYGPDDLICPKREEIDRKEKKA